MARISVFGVGYVGTVSSACLASLGHFIIGVDLAPDKLDLLRNGRSPIVEVTIDNLIASVVAEGRLCVSGDAAAAVAASEMSLICVGTPSAADGSVSLQAVDEVIRQIGNALRSKADPHIVVMRSTVPPGTAEDRLIPLLEHHSGKQHGEGFTYYSNPEFLREGTSVADFRAPPFTLIGAVPGDHAAPLRDLYASLSAPVHVVPYRVAESVKYLSNVYHAVKLAFANEAGAVLGAYGVDAREAFRLFCEDRVLNVSSAYLRPGFAFGGSCLPKDLRSFLSLAEHRAVPTPFLRQLLPSNESIVESAYTQIAQHGRQQVALFGLAFKQGTDDLRESPFVSLSERLIGRGYPLRIFDQAVEVARLTGSNRAYIEKEIPHLGRLMAESPAAALAGSPLVVIGHIDQAARPDLFAALADQVVIDLAGIPELRAHRGIRYQGICGG